MTTVPKAVPQLVQRFGHGSPVFGTARVVESLSDLPTSAGVPPMTWAGAGDVVGAGGVLAAWFGVYWADRLRRRGETHAQANLVAGWVGAVGQSTASLSGEVLVTLANGSAVPVYQVAVFVVAQGGREPATAEAIATAAAEGEEAANQWYRLFAVLPPGRWVIRCPWSSGMLRQPVAEIAFTDAAGAHWVRRASGELQKLPRDPVSCLRLDVTITVAAPDTPGG